MGWTKHRTEIAPKSPLGSQTSVALVITAPARWGFEAVREVFDTIRPTGSEVVFSGELLRQIETGKLYRFEKRSDDCIVVEEA